MTTKKDIENALMRGADTLRDTIDAANYKDYVLPIMFVKYLSDSYEDALDELKKEYSAGKIHCQGSVRMLSRASLSIRPQVGMVIGTP